MDLVTFFKNVVTSPSGGWFCLAYAKIGSDEQKTKESWTEEFYSWPDEISVVIDRVRQLAPDYDVYFSPYLFTDTASIKNNAIVGRTIVADLDEADILTLSLEPTVLVETSPGRHQGYWILKEQLDRQEHESLSKKLTYSIPRCDKTGWFLGKKVRVPETFNNKYIVGPQQVRIVRADGKTYTNNVLENIVSPELPYGEKLSTEIIEEDLSWIEDAMNQEVGPRELLNRVRHSVPTIVARYDLLQKDRSAALWALYMNLFRAGLDKLKVFFIAYHSPNNKFKDLRYGGLRELGKDVLRAQLAIQTQLPDIKSKIREAHILGDNQRERTDYIARCVREYMDKLGVFVHCDDDSGWFIRDDTGYAIPVGVRSNHMQNFLDNTFGINASEKEATFVSYNLGAVVSELPVTGSLATLSHYDHDMRMFVLHTGRKDVLVVTPTGISRHTNGYQGLVFLWSVGKNVISPHYELLDRPWDDELFDGCLDNIVGLDKKSAQAILKVWLITVLLRDGLASRPILALYGTPGSGKSTLFRRIYTLLYGREKGLNTVTREEDFDMAMAREPLLVLDNVDTAARWLPDRLAATVAPTEIVKRKLYTDSDTTRLRRQAMVGITSHNPSNSREDVNDRLILLNFSRLTQFKTESLILNRVAQMRNALWGSILLDIQKVLSTNFPMSGFPQFRVEDFAHFGHWIALALGIEEDFKHGLELIRGSQRSLNLEEDMLLVDSIERMLKVEEISRMPPGEMYVKLRRYSRDERSFERKYRNALTLSRKLKTLLDSLREIFIVEWSIRRGVNVWTIEPLDLEAEVELVGVNGTEKGAD